MRINGWTRYAVWVAGVVMAAPALAQVFKWVDENGRTHYSEKRADAGSAKALQLKLITTPASPQEAASSAEYWREQEDLFQQRRARAEQQQAAAPSNSSVSSTAPKPNTAPTTSASGGPAASTDASRCALARDVLSGAVRHRNGAPTDSHDRQVAENDLRLFCR